MPVVPTRNHRLTLVPNKNNRKGRLLQNTILLFISAVFVTLIVHLLFHLPSLTPNIEPLTTTTNQPPPSTPGYEHFRILATYLASLPPNQTIHILKTQDPFEVRTFESKLKHQELNLQRALSSSELQKLFPCPSSSHRITMPDRRQSHRFISDTSWLFFQHLRKAGGTHFCEIVRSNLQDYFIPKRNCRADKEWTEGTTWTETPKAGYLGHWSNEEIDRRMKESKYRVAGNEWDNFENRFFELEGPPIFLTSIRKPLDRALSQYRFECAEGRGCHRSSVEEWWDDSYFLRNMYTVVFADVADKRDAAERWVSDEPEDVRMRVQNIEKALDVVSRFDYVLVMEWLGYAEPFFRHGLGFDDFDILSKRVLPHAKYFPREDEKNAVKGGSIGVESTKWDPDSVLNEEVKRMMENDLAMDEVLTDAVRRIFLERLVCEDFVNKGKAG